MAAIMMVAETTRWHGHPVTQIFFVLMTECHNTVLLQLYSLT